MSAGRAHARFVVHVTLRIVCISDTAQMIPHSHTQTYSRCGEFPHELSTKLARTVTSL